MSLPVAVRFAEVDFPVVGSHVDSEDLEGGGGVFEEAPAALCLKVARVKPGVVDSGEIWDDRSQTRMSTWIDDRVEDTRNLLHSDVREPVNSEFD